MTVFWYENFVQIKQILPLSDFHDFDSQDLRRCRFIVVWASRIFEQTA